MVRLRLIPLILLALFLVSACVPVPPAGQPSSIPTTPPQATSTLPASPVVQAPTAPAQTPAGVWISLSPQAAAPGDKVEISGYLPGGPDASGAQGQENLLHANVCWQGCQEGLVIQGQTVEWSPDEAGRFTMTFNLPAAPWIGADGPHPLDPGDYTVGIQCLGPDLQGCAVQPAQATAALSLTSAAPTGCPNAECAQLELTPGQSQAGAQVQVTGWAPLDEIIGDMAFGYSLVLQPDPSQPKSLQPIELTQLTQELDGSLSGAFIVPQSLPGLGTLQPGNYTLALQAARFNGQNVVLAPTSFEIGSALAWSAFEPGKPLWIEPSASLAGPLLAVDPVTPGRFAYCDAGSLRLTENGGKSWAAIPTAGVVPAAEAAGYPLSPDMSGTPLCQSAALDSTHTDSFYTVFRTMAKDLGAPPVYFTGFFTTDRGKTWKVVPVPSGAALERAGGFRVDAQLVEALFNGEAAEPGQFVPPVVEQTRDGGATWTPAGLVCPQSQGGPCVRWGPVPGQISGMGSPAPQTVLASPDGGKTWLAGPSVELRMQGPNQLAAFPGTGNPTAALISGGSDFPVQISTDSGKSWQAASLPALPGSGTEGMPFPGLQILPDGSLLALPEGGSWQMLPVGAADWCPLKASGLPQSPVPLQAIGDRLWWLPQVEAASGTVAPPASVPLASLKCG